ncbi:MAG: universal stress protein [Rhodospirillaceae bacterium]|jgi:nucleotide-binding universal stress UspA family protein|nr:universal stress protein [Rhodospirillaceae bacterium]MBT4587710.1 universal stress protein [Rhodospirillaceae bacterium]MBT5939139.1 universal stress protein [Rhodospirillaceae bacterium]MBT7268858.1 universal stress protein [Rhodospirillaceae bacterium]
MNVSQAAKKAEASPVSAAENPATFSRFLVALDASEYADHALAQVLNLVPSVDGQITGIHAYAARLHDARFRQMEGGLPERYLDEEEMQYQRDVHDDLITDGLSIITDSYHDVAKEECDKRGLKFQRLSPEGKNYTKIVEAAVTGDHDVLALGSLGLGAVPGSLIGTVCERVVRRSPIDCLVIRDTQKEIGDGPIVVAIDGSAKSYGVLKRAFEIARRIDAEVHIVSSYDPYYHYVAFNKIASVLSDEAGKVFRFREQEALHEELIDDGIAKIYQSNLEIANKIAEEEGVEVVSKLLEGKAFKVICDYLEEVSASLLMVGMTGVHADSKLDIGGNAENLLRLSPCHIWLGQTEHVPPMEVVAEETISWSNEAEEFLKRAPSFVQDMAKKAVNRYAQEKGHTFITQDIVEIVANDMMPGGGRSQEQLENEQSVTWSSSAEDLVKRHVELPMAANVRLRAEKRARRNSSKEVLDEHILPFIDTSINIEAGVEGEFVWAAAALARLSRVPDAMRDATRARIESVAQERGTTEVTLEIAEAGLELARSAMSAAIDAKEEPDESDEVKAFACPFAAKAKEKEAAETDKPTFEWAQDAEQRMAKIPEGFMRDMTRQRVEVYAEKHNIEIITEALVEEKYAEWGKGSAKQKRKMAWDEDAAARVQRIPDFVRGMVELEIERCARELELDRVTTAAVDKASEAWEGMGDFHSDANPELYKKE